MGIAREAHTELPSLPASSIRGKIRMRSKPSLNIILNLKT
jgi:CRISPR/Cas system CMR subunit Cmr4 (Cas7 group RAMP superfamily)